MNLLLDTHVFLWWLSDDRRLSKKVRTLIAKPTTRAFVSAASTWEIAIKITIGKLTLKEKDQRRLPELPEACGFAPLPISHAHAAEICNLPLYHADPFDRILIAQARLENLELVTADERLTKYDVKTRWAARP